MVISVFVESALFDPVVNCELILLADGNSNPSAGRFRGKLLEPPAYCGNMIRWKGVPLRPKFGSRRLLQVPSWLRKRSFRSQFGVGSHGHFLFKVRLVKPFRSDRRLDQNSIISISLIWFANSMYALIINKMEYLITNQLKTKQRNWLKLFTNLMPLTSFCASFSLSLRNTVDVSSKLTASLPGIVNLWCRLLGVLNFKMYYIKCRREPPVPPPFWMVLSFCNLFFNTKAIVISIQLLNY